MGRWRLGLALWTAVLAGLPTAWPATAEAQVVIDTVVRRLGTRVITHLDIWSVRRLRLLTVEATSDEDVLRALENRALTVAELDRFPLDEPSQAAVAAARAGWVQRVGPTVAGRAAEAGMDDAELDVWFRNDVRIQAYLDTRFGAMPPEDRPAAIERWINSLRARAFLR